MNPQIVYGEDVMSRIQYTISEPDGLEKQHKAVIGTLNGLPLPTRWLTSPRSWSA